MIDAKILLIGELEEIIRSVNECLENDFQVQICSEKIDMVRGMAKICHWRKKN